MEQWLPVGYSMILSCHLPCSSAFIALHAPVILALPSTVRARRVSDSPGRRHSSRERIRTASPQGRFAFVSPQAAGLTKKPSTAASIRFSLPALLALLHHDPLPRLVSQHITARPLKMSFREHVRRG